MTTALIDGDIVCYLAAALAQRDGGWDGSPTGPTFTPSDVDRLLTELLDEWTSKANCSDRKVFCTGRENFRYQVDPTYKGNRKNSKRPVALDYAKAALREAHGAIWVEGLEADDLLGLSLTGSYSEGRGVCVSADKDMLTLPGLHLNPNKDTKVRKVSLVDANRYWMSQVLTGDATDGYGGAKGIGPKKAEALLEGQSSLGGLWSAVVAGYASVQMTERDALTTARLARILRKGDYDKATKEVLLWHPSKSIRMSLPSRPSEPLSEDPSPPSPSC